ncbi:MAG: sulfur carrier protein ThiS [Prochloraceae cyanobacterium]|nr:sulfur carrier protein ThiS [Prochloraceae cyanobacterium]
MFNTKDAIDITINGEGYNCAIETKLPDLLENLGFNLRLIAIEYNGEILHKQYWPQTELNHGDRLEIVTIVGGG